MKNKFLLVDEIIDVNYSEHDSFSYFRLYNKTFRTTETNRLDDINVLANEYIPETRPLQILDLAISSGITSIEWKDMLDEAGINNNYLATDATIYGTRAELGSVTFLFEEIVDKNRQYLLQVDLFGYAFPNASGSRWRNAVCRIISWITRPFIIKGSKVYIIDPAVRKKSESDNTFSLEQINLFELSKKISAPSFNVVRATNILNKAYFDDDKINIALSGIKDVMVQNGLFIVARTHMNGSNHGAYYQLIDNVFQCVGTIGEGSEIHNLISSI